MFADLLTAIDLLLGAVKNIKSSDVKRQKIAKRLLRIYLDIDEIVERGEGILSFLKGESSQVYEVVYAKLVHQQKALDAISNSLSDPIISSLLKVHAPNIMSLKVFILGKGQRIGFYLSQLTTNAEINAEIERRKREIEEKYRKIQKKRGRKTSEEMYDDIYEYEKEEEIRNLPRKVLMSQLDLNSLDYHDINLILNGNEHAIRELSGYWKRTDEREIDNKKVVKMFATQRDIETASADLVEIKRLGERLRLFLTEKFQLEDIL